MPDRDVEPLTDSIHLLDMAADVLDHDDALRIVRRLGQRFPCMRHERVFCDQWHATVFEASDGEPAIRIEKP